MPQPLSVPRRLSVVVLVGWCLAASGCASLSEAECEEGNWYAIGLADGRTGFTEARLADHGSSCEMICVKPNTSEYERGRTAGLTDYCTAESGVRAGFEHKLYRDVCSGETEADFLAGYRAGVSASLSPWAGPGTMNGRN